MSEAQVAEKSAEATQVKPIREVDFGLFSQPQRKDGVSLRRTALQHTVMGIVREEGDRETKDEKVAKIASDAFNVQHDSTAAAMAIAIYSRNVAREAIVALYGKKQANTEHVAKMLEQEQVMRDDLVRKSGLPEDFFESNGFLTPLKPS